MSTYNFAFIAPGVSFFVVIFVKNANDWDQKKHFWCPNQSLKTTLVVQTFPKYGNIFYILTEPRTVKFQVLGDQTTSGNLHSGVVIDLGGAVLPGSYPTTMAATTTEWISN